jgi:hypothetical protein
MLEVGICDMLVYADDRRLVKAALPGVDLAGQAV